MKNNTDQAKQFLQKAISSMPPDFALREVRHHLQQAAQKLEHVERKRATAQPKQPTQHQVWREKLNNGLNNPFTAKNTLDIVDAMLAEEYAKLENILERKRKSSTDNDFEEEGDPILG